METKNYSKWNLILIVCGLLLSGCSNNNNPEESKSEPLNVAENIIGNWLLASSTQNEWASFEFTKTSRINATVFENQNLQTGTGFYWVDEDKSSITGNYDFGNGQLPIYIDWVVEKVQPFEVTIKLYNNNQYLGNTAIYRLLTTNTVVVNSTSEIDFKSICGTDNVSEFTILDPTVASISSTGTVTGIKIGETYMTFNTTGGHAAIKIEVTPAIKSFEELVVGTWIYDVHKEKEWQKTTFVADGFVDVKWANPYSYTTIETANGYYSISDNICSFTVTTPYNQTYNQEWHTDEINEFIWTYQSYNDNESVGVYTGHRLLGTVSLEPGKQSSPDYSVLTFGYEILGYSSNNAAVASVNAETGEIIAIDYGRTYINVNTSKGAGYYEVYVE